MELKEVDDKMFKLLLAMKMYEVCDPIDLVMEFLDDDISKDEDCIELLGDTFDAAESILMMIYGFTDTDLLKKIYSANYGEASEKELQTELNALGIDDLWAAKIAMEKEQAEIEKQLDDLRTCGRRQEPRSQSRTNNRLRTPKQAPNRLRTPK